MGVMVIKLAGQWPHLSLQPRRELADSSNSTAVMSPLICRLPIAYGRKLKEPSTR